MHNTGFSYYNYIRTFQIRNNFPSRVEKMKANEIHENRVHVLGIFYLSIFRLAYAKLT